MKTSGGIFDLPSLVRRSETLQKRLSSREVWESPAKTQELLKEKSNIDHTIQQISSMEKRLEDINILLQLLEEESEDGEELLKDIQRDIRTLRVEIEDMELRSLLSGEHDRSNAIMSIHPGAGGTESQDWAQILMRMYLRWAERKGFKAEIVDILPGEGAGIKSATLTFTGPYAYGYLKAEAGVHRLVRISPFDANRRRHTSFVAVLVYPEIGEEIKVEIKEDDLRIDTYRASGAGGQHVNKTYSAVRITHLPTGIVVSCQNERSQHKNRATAMKILKARLYALKKQEHERKLQGLVGEKKEIAWGNQIRSYILQPYQLVKDHRTGLETGNVEAVLDGEIDEFIREYLTRQRQT